MICVGMSASFEASTLPLFFSEYVLASHWSTVTVVATPSS